MYSCLSGGLGNQMFQYAAAYILQRKLKQRSLVLDDSYFLDCSNRDTRRRFELNQFNICYDRLTTSKEKKEISIIRHVNRYRLPLFVTNSIFGVLLKKNYLPEAKFYEFLNNCKLQVKNGYCLFSYFQDATLIDSHRDMILPLFQINEDLLNLCNDLHIYKKVICENANTTSLHIRRGDYITNPHASKFHGVLPMDYYEKAIRYIEDVQGEQVIIVFSDDAKWAENTFANQPNYYVVNNSECEYSAIDMFLMSKCKNNIIANSTYSWWGAWLNTFEDKIVVSPRKWFAGNNKSKLTMDSWINL